MCVCGEGGGGHVSTRPDLDGVLRTEGRSHGPDDVEPGEGAGGEEGAGQHHKIPLSHLQAGFSHGHPEGIWKTNNTNTTEAVT